MPLALKDDINTSLIITTYNWPQALRLCLESVAEQSLLPNRVIIADDGSTDETRALITTYAAKLPFELRHVWQEDSGFRRSAILNKALRKVPINNYVIFIDGDIILHKHFIKDHVRLAEPGYYVFGRRCYLGENLSTRLLNGEQCALNFFTRGIRRRDNLLYLPWLTTITTRYRRGKLYGYGCNLAAWMNDIVKVNGYEERMEGWGCEDDDFIQRLRNNGLISKAAKYQAIEYHIYHKQRPVSDDNRKLLSKVQLSFAKRCEFGLQQL